MSNIFFKSNLENPLSVCILIASHITSEKRITYLIETLKSFMKQTLLIPVYLSISFESEDLNSIFMQAFAKTPDSFKIVVFLYINPKKTPQMRHMASVFPLIQKRYNWVMFSDDDDLYGDNEVHHDDNLETNTQPMDELATNITNSLGSLIQNYLDNEDTNTSRRTTFNTNQILSDINTFVNRFDSAATSVEFEFPLLIYRDLSGNRRTFL